MTRFTTIDFFRPFLQGYMVCQLLFVLQNAKSSTYDLHIWNINKN